MQVQKKGSHLLPFSLSNYYTTYLLGTVQPADIKIFEDFVQVVDKIHVGCVVLMLICHSFRFKITESPYK